MRDNEVGRGASRNDVKPRPAKQTEGWVSKKQKILDMAEKQHSGTTGPLPLGMLEGQEQAAAARDSPQVHKGETACLEEAAGSGKGGKAEAGGT